MTTHKTAEDYERMYVNMDNPDLVQVIREAMTQARDKERERCARICEDYMIEQVRVFGTRDGATVLRIHTATELKKAIRGAE